MKNIYVYSSSGNADTFLGTIYVDKIRGNETYSFEFDSKALESGAGSLLCDAELLPMLGRQHKSDPHLPYHFMSDSSPDRWGRSLLNKKMGNKALFESEYLLGVSDVSRMGALRYKTDKDGPFLAETEDIPPFRFLRELEDAAHSFDEYSLDPKWISLLAPGSSLGGARPKATIYDVDGTVCLAKFSAIKDSLDYPSIEYWTYLLAKEAGIDIMPSRIIRFENGRSVFITKRFDREGAMRIHYASFMTILNANDGESSSYTYLDMADAVTRLSAKPKEDLKQLFLRIAFSLFVHNYDDHLRNHAMIRRGNTWNLSPAFDLNISLDKAALTMTIDGTESSLNSLINAAPFFGLSVEMGQHIVDGMRNKLKGSFEKTAKLAGINKSLQDTAYRILEDLH